MAAFVTVSKVLAEAQPGSYAFFCNGCDMPHVINVDPAKQPCWGFDNNLESPTFSPSVLVNYKVGEKNNICHSFVKAGQIQYLGDCTHKLVSQTVDIPDWDEALERW